MTVSGLSCNYVWSLWSNAAVTVASYAEKAVYLVLYHILLLLFMWSYYQTVMTPIARVPKQVRQL